MTMILSNRIRTMRGAQPSPRSRSWPRSRRGFTLIELLVVMAIILLVSVVALTTIMPAYNDYNMSAAARVLQGGLTAARDIAMNTGAPAGIRLLPDPAYNGIDPSTGNAGDGTNPPVDPARILASNRFVPIQLAPDYSEGLIRIDTAGAPLNAYADYGTDPVFAFPYNLQQIINPAYAVTPTYYPAATWAMLYIEESVYNNTTGLLNPPTSWYWNIRIGDKVQIAKTGIYYTVVGPMTIPNPELFVNVGPPGTPPPLQRTTVAGVNYNPEILFLVNGLDDNGDGYVDNGFDGIDNDGDGIVDQVESTAFAFPGEWVETEAWQSGVANRSTVDVPYTIIRRPVVMPQARETFLPANVVVDLTTALTTRERSRLPVDQTTGYVDIMINPNGTLLPTTLHSNPAAFGMSSTFFHFWLAERTDLFDPLIQNNVPYRLPMVTSARSGYPNANDAYGATRELKGHRALVTLNTRTGYAYTNQIEDSSFDGTTAGAGGGVNRPFLLPQQGVRGDTR